MKRLIVIAAIAFSLDAGTTPRTSPQLDPFLKYSTDTVMSHYKKVQDESLVKQQVLNDNLQTLNCLYDILKKQPNLCYTKYHNRYYKVNKDSDPITFSQISKEEYNFLNR